MKAWLLAGCVLGALLCACNEQQPPRPPGSFDRPTRVAFACFDLSDPQIPRVASLSTCDPTSKEALSGDVITHALHALVVQSSRGEVAAVDTLNRHTLDSRRDIPGYTFLPVGELPRAIVVPPTAPHAEFTYVANAGSRDITVLKTQAFRELEANESPTVQTLPLPGGSRDAPFDMVLSPEEDALFVSLPDSGRLLRVPIQRCNESSPAEAPVDAGEAISEAGLDAGMSDGATSDATVSDPGTSEPTDPAQPCLEGRLDPDHITEIPIGDSVARDATDTSPDVPAEGYLKACAFKAPVSNASLPLPELPADIAMLQPKPSGIAVDSFCENDGPCPKRLLVADLGLPLIHVIDLDAVRSGGSDVIQPPIRTGAPTTSVVVTPRVPVDTSGEGAETQYVYAIDATDGSVLVTEHGRLLEVGPEGARPDRVSLGGGQTVPVAISLAVMTPAFNLDGPANQYAVRTPDNSLMDPSKGNFCVDTTHTIRSNLRLRGVFLAVGVTDGTVRVIDIHDMDVAECRSCDPAADNWDPYPLVRHRTRIAITADRMMGTSTIAPIAQPTFFTGTNAAVVRVTGTTSDPLIKGLDCVQCGDGQVRAFPNQAAPGVPDQTEPGVASTPADACDSGNRGRVCAQNDPWAQLDDWAATYQGVIPGSRGGDASLVENDGRVELQQPNGRFCSLGVLGEDELAKKSGDRLNVVGPLPPDAAIEQTEPHAGDPKSTVGRTFEADVLAACKKLVSARDNTAGPVPIAFTIQQAFDDRLVLSPDLENRAARLGGEFENDWQFVNKCFGGMPLTYQVRVGAGYVVVGRDTSGFIHRVRAEEGTRHCAVDTTQDARRNGRAYEGEPFDNGFVTFQLTAAGSAPPKIDTTLELGLVPSTPKAVMNASITVNAQVVAAIPFDLEWSQQDDRLYMVDIASNRLVPIPVDLWPSTGGTSTSFQ